MCVPFPPVLGRQVLTNALKCRMVIRLSGSFLVRSMDTKRGHCRSELCRTLRDQQRRFCAGTSARPFLPICAVQENRRSSTTSPLARIYLVIYALAPRQPKEWKLSSSAVSRYKETWTPWISVSVTSMPRRRARGTTAAISMAAAEMIMASFNSSEATEMTGARGVPEKVLQSWPWRGSKR